MALSPKDIALLNTMTQSQATAWLAKNHGSTPKAELVMTEHTDETGRRIREFSGNPKMWMQEFMSAPQRQLKIWNTNSSPAERMAFAKWHKQTWEGK